MKTGQARVTFLIFPLFLILAGCGSTYTAEYRIDDPSPPVRCFAETGHSVSGNFSRYFEGMGGADSLGYPISEPFMQEGRKVQYFEYARLEDHPDNPGGAVVKLSQLGERLGRRQPPLAASRLPSGLDHRSRYYRQTGHTVSGDFLTFFDEKGGLERFGFPIGEPLVVNGKLAQDFQHARLVWNANRPPQNRVTLEPIGRTYFEIQGLGPALLDPIPCPSGGEVTK